MIQRPRPRISDPYHHVGGVYLSGRLAQLDHPKLMVWVQAPEVLAWPRRGHLWRPSIVHEAEPARPTFRDRCRAAWRALLTDPRELMP